MSGGFHQRAKELFLEVREAPAEERESTLQRLAGGDAALEAEVRSLIGFDADECAEARGEHLVGVRVGGYRIERVIGAGGMGVVLEASQEHPARRVAIKVLDRPGISRAMRERFRFEADALARLRHDGIARVLDAGELGVELGSAPFFVMELVERAATIVEHARASGLPMPQRLELFAEACDAIHHGHQRGILHRDIKPSNTLVDNDGRVRIIDYGIAREVGEAPGVTRTGQLVGTPRYMSPEQLDGDPRLVDVRTDVHALGVLLHELCVGTAPPLVGSAADGDREGAARRRESWILAETRSAPAPVRAIIARSLRLDRDERYQSAGALADDVRRYLRGEPVEAQDATLRERVARWVVTHPVAASAGVGGLIILVALAASGVVAFVMNLQPYGVERDGARLHVVSRSGVRLAHFEGPARWWEQQTLGTDPRDWSIVVGVDDIGGSDHLGSLVVLDRRAQIRWATTGRRDFIHPDTGEIGTSRDYPVAHRGVTIADVLGGPGKEIVVAHKRRLAGSEGETVIRVYDGARGEVLFEAWHDGTMHMTSVDGSGTVYVGGIAERGALRRARAAADRFDAYFPALMSLRPAVGERRGWLGPDAMGPGEWYVVIEPTELAADLATKGVRPPHGDAADLGAQWVLGHGLDVAGEAGLYMFLDRAGLVTDRGSNAVWGSLGLPAVETFTVRRWTGAR